MQDYSAKIKELLQEQLNEWELAKKNFDGLNEVKVKEFNFDGFTIKVQFNPARIRSSAAKVDKKSIQERACFLCAENRPKEQRGVEFGDYTILINPFPIFPEHFTVPTLEHIPQLLQGKFSEMLDLAKAIEGNTVFYNGPKCGASAPDHFHFQAGVKGFMPIDSEIESLKIQYGKKLDKIAVDCWAVKDGLRNFLVLESADKEKLLASLDQIYKVMHAFSPETVEEPMMNVLASYEADQWQVLVFPRALHRPWQYFEEGEKNFVFSPASVDLGGVLITPLEKDFEKITKEDITDMLHQVLLADGEFDQLVEQIVKYC